MGELPARDRIAPRCASTAASAPAVAVDVLHRGPTGLVQSRSVRLPGPGLNQLVLTPDGRYLIGAALRGALVLDTARLEAGDRGALLGCLFAGDRREAAAHVAVSRDGRFAFLGTRGVGQAGGIEVFDLRLAIAHGLGPRGLVGTVPTGQVVVGMSISPDGRFLYAADSVRNTVAVVAVRRAETDPGQAVVHTVTAGCGPILTTLSPDGQTLWVTDVSSNALVAFGVPKLIHDPRHAITAVARVGHGPVGVAVVDHGRRILVADTGRNGPITAAAGNLAVLDPAALLAHKRALKGNIPIPGLPREISFLPGTNTALITNYDRGLASVNTATLP